MKKIFAILVALTMIMALSVTAFAEELVIFDNPEGEQVTVTADPWDGFGLGVAPVNGSHVGDLPIEDVVKYAEADAALVMVYTSTGCWGGESHPEIEFNVWEAEELTESIAFELTKNDDGTITATVNLGDVLDNYIAFGYDVNDIKDCGIQLWGENFKLVKLSIVTDTPVPEETPAVEDTETEAPAEEDTTTEAPAVEETPAETGLSLAVIPAIVALCAVAISKRR